MTEQSNNQMKLIDFMQTNPEGTLEKIAQDYQVSLSEVIQALPNVKLADGNQFDTIWQEVETWGEITFLIHTKDIIAEFSGELPSGSHRAGYFNLKHKQGLSGHIKAEHCQQIAFIERNFMKMSTASIIFLNKHGEAMFKIFVGRDSHHQLKADQLDKFKVLAQRYNKKI